MNKRKPVAATRATRRGRGSRSTPADGTEQTTAGSLFVIRAECTIADVALLKSDLAKLLDEPEVVILDVSTVQRIDTAGLQVIATFIRERESHSRQVQWRGHAAALASAVKLLGLSALLKLPATEEPVETAP
jgi:ABC-type transporter Mla MlaB component